MAGDQSNKKGRRDFWLTVNLKARLISNNLIGLGRLSADKTQKLFQIQI